jgi:putative salt-induced outer membrane protein
MGRMTSVIRVLFVAAIVLVPVLARAQTAAPPPPPRQEGTAELAFVGTTGNISTSTFSVGAEHIVRPTNWLVKNRIQAIRGTVEGATTAEALLYNFRAERVINARLSAFGDYGFLRDKPAGVTSRHAVGGGLSLKAIADARQTLSIDGGLGYLEESRLAGDDISSAIWLTGAAYKLKLSETAELTDDLRLLGTFDRGEDWRLTHSIAVTARLTSLLSLKVSNHLRFANFPPAGFKKTDTTTAIALVASFKRQ